MLHIENRILRLIADNVPVRETIDQLCREIENVLPGVVCTVLPAAPSDLLQSLGISAARQPPIEVENLLTAMDLKRNGGATERSAPICIPDIAGDTAWRAFSGSYLAQGLNACWISPVTGREGETLGAMIFHLREPHTPDAHESAVFSACLDLCGLVLRRHRLVSERERRVNVDALTGLPNRAAFNAALGDLACATPGAWALFVIDLDNLKTVNDSLGHQAGDGLIRAAGERISRVMSPDVTFRLGGDEFAVIVRQPDALERLDSTAQLIFEALEQPAICDGHSVVPGATIGGAVPDAGDVDAKAVYQKADFALYHAKETGRGGFVRYWPGIGSRITLRRDSIRTLSAALEEDRIDAYYQPIVRLDTRKIAGLEALCRLTTEEGEVLAAGAFREATADAHVASELTGRMLAIVARDVRSWLDAGIAFGQIGVNVSLADFYTGDLIGKLKESFGKADLSLEHLMLEVSEAVPLGQCNGVVARKIKLLREMGVQVALDDFGTAHASLTQLLNLPVDAIKIDGTMIARLWPDDPSLAVVEGLIDIARRLDIKVIAEGVETEVEASQLWMMGCKFGQGFAFAPAVDRTAVRHLLLKHAQAMPGTIPLYSRAQRTRARNILRVPQARALA